MSTMPSPSELQQMLNDNRADPSSILEWTMSMLQTKAAMDQAIGTFHSVTDKEIAAKAAYKSLGLDPRDAPVFGWNMSERPKQSVNQTIINSGSSASEQQPERPVPSPIKGGGPAFSNQTSGSWNMIKSLLTTALVAALATGGTYFSMSKDPTEIKVAQEMHVIQQQQLLAKIQEVQAALKVNPSSSDLQKEICEELDSDPEFRAEIAKDLQAIAAKILEHKRKRLAQ